jgi:hypothetical protein
MPKIFFKIITLAPAQQDLPDDPPVSCGNKTLFLQDLVSTRVARFFLAHNTKTGKMYQTNTVVKFAFA